VNPGVFPFRLRTGPDQLTLDRMPARHSTTRPPYEDGFAVVLGQALETRGVSLVALQRRLADRGHRVSAGTLSYWRSGQRQPEKPASLDAVTEIEELLGLDPGALHGRIGPSRRPGPPLPQVAVGAAAPADVPVQDALRELGLAEAGQQLQDVTLQVTLDVNAEGQMTRQTVRTMLRATASGAQRWYHVIFAEQPVPEPLVLDRVVGARVGARVDRPEVGLVATELVLPRPLEVGETAIIETSTLLIDLGGPDTTYFHHIDRRMSEVVIWVRFDPAALPTRCVQTVQAMKQTAVETPLHLGGLDTVHVAARSFGPGSVGLTWEW
jgi:hypothetical protein